MSVIPFNKRTGTPTGPRDVASTIRAGHRGQGSSARLIVVGGGKGGTGKSLMAANLAVLGSLRGRRVTLVDADLGLANLHLLLGVEPVVNLSKLLEPGWFSNRPAPDVLTPGPAGVSLLAGAAGVGRLAGLNRGELRRLIHRLEPCVRQSDLVLVDLSSGITPSTQLLLRSAREVLVVANPEPTSILDAYGVIKLLSESGHVGEIHLIMNRTHDLAQGRESARRVLATAREHLGRNVHSLDCVPEDPAVARSVQRRRPVVLDRPDSPAASSLRTIAQRLFDGAAPHGNTLSAFFSTAKALIAPRRRSTRSSCAL